MGFVPDPSWVDPQGTCGNAGCHEQNVALAADSLHLTLAGIRHSLVERGGGEPLSDGLQTSFDNHCARCHASCGDCHFSVPASAGGGLLSAHRVRRTPSMTLVCTACHGSRVGDEFLGDNPEMPADVHYNAGMQCTACHTGEEMHGGGASGATHRYQVSSAPRCNSADCHPDDDAFRDTLAHGQHRDEAGNPTVSCQVCHSVAYKNCESCHVSLNDENKPVYEVNAPSFESLMTFKIGLNPEQDDLHPERWVVLRHVPAAPDDYDFYGAGLMSTFDANPTWRLATPHAIQRVTPQNESCVDSCHGQRELFLGPVDLEAYEITANEGVVVPDELLPLLP